MIKKKTEIKVKISEYKTSKQIRDIERFLKIFK